MPARQPQTARERVDAREVRLREQACLDAVAAVEHDADRDGLAVAPAAVGLALFVYTMDVLVAFLQAYIFTMLTALFVGGAVHPH